VVTIGAAYASDLSRVRITCSGAPSLADHAVIERSVDEITWFTVRGGSAVTLTAGACQLDDYEFVPGQLNYYRARYVDAADPSVVSIGTLSSANNANVTPGLPAGAADGDVMVLLAAIRNTAGSVNTPAGWTLWTDGGNFRVFVKIYATGDVAPTVTFSGGVANADTFGRISLVRNSDYTISNLFQANASAQNVAFPAMAVAPISPDLFMLLGWKQSGGGGGTADGWATSFINSVTAGDDMVGFALNKLSSVDSAAGSVTITGGSSAISEVALLRFTRRPYVSQETATVTPVIDRVWMKNLQQPFLNRVLTPTGFSEIELPSRSGSFVVANRSKSFAVTEVRGGNEFTLTVKTETDSEREDLQAVLASGDVVLLQLPHDFKRFPGGYYLIQDVKIRRASATFGTRRYFDLQLEETSAPSFELVGNTVTWQGIINSYATWADLIADNPTWQDVMNRIGTPADVVVP
jgi:hypothetical protein